MLFEYKDIFARGSIYKYKIHNVCSYSVYGKKTLIKLINVINGKFRTPKIIYLYRAIYRMN